ncbi:MAG: bifunctional 4-hydroxy-3-methylbut-2-enyl diphosphate reductase/30S ribosomal protein S1 [Syntrophomonadaceae bacterium]|nr:bifunctional 4-hydroxy-3-methylbut-2-enyl diphosphate reductase/30S ribosomal protein S1 [Syntrophomonadaceae bacterium]
MQILLAEHAGFCAGVKRAVKIAREACVPGGCYTLGPLVHNQAVVAELAQQGIDPVDNVEQLQAGDKLVIRSHGCSPQIIDQAQKRDIMLIDATCPRVARIHQLVADLHEQGYDVVIFGDAAHPEVQGIVGWCETARVVKDRAEAELLPRMDKVGVVSQTTKEPQDYFAAIAAILPKVKELRVFNTICSATTNRIKVARELSQQVDLMIVIGDAHSSNTATLVRECLNTGVTTYRVQTAADIQPDWFQDADRIGITAGASTPDWIIKEVISRMTGYDEEREDQNQAGEKPGNEESFAKLEAEMAGLATPSRGEVIKGTVVQVLDDEVMVDVGGKSEGVIPLRELSLKEVSSARDLVQVGDEIEVLVLKWDDDGTILLSKKKVDFKKTLDELEVAFNEKRPVEGTIIESVKGGLLADVGVVGFLPASHVDDGYVKNLDDYIGQTMLFNIIEFNRNKRRGSQVVLSRRELVLEEKNRQKMEFWQNIAEGQTRTGIVKRIVDYGAFIDLGGYEGLLHVSELDHRRVEHPADVLNEGDQIEVYILGLDREKERVSLSRKKLLKSPWELALEKYHQGDIVEGTVVRIAPFGAFVELDPGVDGLVHISQLADYRVEKPEDVVKAGDKVMVKIISIDPDEKRIGLSIKEARNELNRLEVEQYLESKPDDDI